LIPIPILKLDYPIIRKETMAKYTELQTRKLISSYGGVGSIIETIEGALIIKEFDKWFYFRQIEKGKIEIEDNENINDERLLKRLRFYFPKLIQIVKVPANYSAIYNAKMPQLKNHIIDAEYFPKWFYCNNCKSFKHIDDWYEGWKNVFHNKEINKINDSFTPPKCYKCFQTAKKTKGKKYHTLEQVRFILTAPNGNIRDLPWNNWTNLSREKDENGLQKIIFNGKCCDKQNLRYLRGDKSDFSGIRIQCTNPECKTKGKQVSLAGLLGLRVPDFDKNGEIKIVSDNEGNPVLDIKGHEQKIFFKPVIRTSNSVYYPLITNSLYLPIAAIKKEIKDKIKTLFYDAELSVEKIQEKVNKDDIKLSISEINEIVNPKEQDFIKEVDYRLKEYNYLTTNESPDDNDLVFEQETSELFSNFGISKLLKINRLKLTSVQTGFSRQEPIDKDLFSENSMDDFIRVSKDTVKAKYTSSKGSATKLLPGIESFGEGIFIDFDIDKISAWYDAQSLNKDFTKRIETILNNGLNSQYKPSKEKEKILDNPTYLSKFIFIHTFSHLLIKELEFLTGYSASSISERLYVNENDMQGVLIYTMAGAEGSFGGLVSQANPERFIKILESALARAKDCASDPICYNSEGQGIGGLNLAACYSCSLLPETSCEEFNSYLDRAMLIDEKFGFYKET
jgi:MrfA Zn-binding domain